VDDIEFRDRAVYLGATNTLVVADLHLGRAASSNVDVPLDETGDIHSRLAALIERFEPQQVVFAGDILHSFSTVPRGVEQTVSDLYEQCLAAGCEPIATEGNHDTQLESVWPDDIVDSVRLADGTVICHGHTVPDRHGERYIIGHDHPTISIEGKRHPCLCVDPTGYRGRELLVLPAFTRLASGVELNQLRADALQSPLISSVDSLQPHIWDAESKTTLEFPPLGEFRRLL